MLCSEGWIITKFSHIFLQVTSRHCSALVFHKMCPLSRYKNILQFNTECCIAVDKGEELPEINRIKNELCVRSKYSILTHRDTGRMSWGSWWRLRGPGWSCRPPSPPPTWTWPSSPWSSSPPSTWRTLRPASRSWGRARAWRRPSPRSSRRTSGSSGGVTPCRSCGS